MFQRFSFQFQFRFQYSNFFDSVFSFTMWAHFSPSQKELRGIPCMNILGVRPFRIVDELRADQEFLRRFAKKAQNRMQWHNVEKLRNSAHRACMTANELFAYLCYVAALSRRNVAVVSPEFFVTLSHEAQTKKDKIRAFDTACMRDDKFEIVLLPVIALNGQNAEDVGHWVRRLFADKPPIGNGWGADSQPCPRVPALHLDPGVRAGHLLGTRTIFPTERKKYLEWPYGDLRIPSNISSSIIGYMEKIDQRTEGNSGREIEVATLCRVIFEGIT